MTNGKLVLILSAVALAGCGTERDAASEPPIAMKGGIYSINFDGSAFGLASPVPLNDKKPSKTCVRYNEGDGWIYMAIREHVTPGPYCRTENSKRTGNLISGRVACQLPRGEGGGDIALEYSGIVSEEGVDLTGKILPPENIRANSLSEEDEAKLRMMLKVMDVSIKIRREGDC
jgi:hypothetical protein